MKHKGRFKESLSWLDGFRDWFEFQSLGASHLWTSGHFVRLFVACQDLDSTLGFRLALKIREFHGV